MISDPCVPQSLKIRTKTQLSLNYRDCVYLRIGDLKRNVYLRLGTGKENYSQISGPEQNMCPKSR